MQKKEDDVLKDFLQVVVGSIGFELTERTWDRRGVVRLKSVEVIDHLTKGEHGVPTSCRSHQPTALDCDITSVANYCAI